MQFPWISALACAAALGMLGCHDSHGAGNDSNSAGSRSGTIGEDAQCMIEEGRKTFRFDTFGDEDFWGGKLRLHEALMQVTPKVALEQGLKVDSEALPGNII